MLRVPGDLPPEDGAADAHGVPHGGDALQGQAWPVPRAVGQEAAQDPSPWVPPPCSFKEPRLPCPSSAPHLQAGPLVLWGLVSSHRGQAQHPCGWGMGRLPASPAGPCPLSPPAQGWPGYGAGCPRCLWPCLPVLLLLPAVHAEEGLAEPHDQAARSSQAPRCECVAVLRAGPARSDAGTVAAPGVAVRFLPCGVSRGARTPGQPRPALTLLPLSGPFCPSVPPVPSASCPGQNCSCTRLSSTAERSCLCVRSVGTGPRAGTACRCTPRPSTGWGWPVFPQGLALRRLQASKWPGRQCADTRVRAPAPNVRCLQGQQRAEQVCQAAGGGESRLRQGPVPAWAGVGVPLLALPRPSFPRPLLEASALPEWLRRLAQASLFPWLGPGGALAAVE